MLFNYMSTLGQRNFRVLGFFCSCFVKKLPARQLKLKKIKSKFKKISDIDSLAVGKTSFILDKVLAVNNKRNQLKIKEIKVYRSKQSMTSSGNIKTKIYIAVSIQLHYDIKLKITKICLHCENEGFSLFHLRCANHYDEVQITPNFFF